VQFVRDLFDEVPARAYLNAQFIGLGERFGAFRDAQRIFLQEKGVGSYSLSNPALIASLLYCLVVVPKEFWQSAMPSSAVDALNSRSDFIINLFQITVWQDRPEASMVYDATNSNCLIQKLRNAISHARVEIFQETGNVTFTDLYKNNVRFKATLTMMALNQFFEELSVFANLPRGVTRQYP